MICYLCTAIGLPAGGSGWQTLKKKIEKRQLYTKRGNKTQNNKRRRLYNIENKQKNNIKET